MAQQYPSSLGDGVKRVRISPVPPFVVYILLFYSITEDTMNYLKRNMKDFGREFIKGYHKGWIKGFVLGQRLARRLKLKK